MSSSKEQLNLQSNSDFSPVHVNLNDTVSTKSSQKLSKRISTFLTTKKVSEQRLEFEAPNNTEISVSKTDINPKIRKCSSKESLQKEKTSSKKLFGGSLFKNPSEISLPSKISSIEELSKIDSLGSEKSSSNHQKASSESKDMYSRFLFRKNTTKPLMSSTSISSLSSKKTINNGSTLKADPEIVVLKKVLTSSLTNLNPNVIEAIQICENGSQESLTLSKVKKTTLFFLKLVF